MDQPSDEHLLKQIREDKRRDAFESLIERYEQRLLTLIRIRLNTRERADIEDVLQDTLIQAWLSLTRTTPSNFQSWLYQLGRNRCTDWVRMRTKAQKARDAISVPGSLDRRGIRVRSEDERIDEIIDALEQIPVRERRALSDFYFQGFSIAEIASRHQTTQGTIKRRLSYGRDMVRNELDVPRKTRTATMNTNTEVIKDLPQTRPNISISCSTTEPFPIDLQELAWWFIVPQIGESVRWALYEAVDEGKSFKLKSIHSMHAKHGAEIHGRECVEIDIDEQEPSDGEGFLSFGPKDKSLRIWGCLTDTEVQWIAYESEQNDGKRILYTFLDKGWDQDFGVCDRMVPLNNSLQEQDSEIRITTSDLPRVFCDRVFDVAIGDSKPIECMRVFEIEREPTDAHVLIEAYVSRAGRTVLMRRYNGNRWAKAKDSEHFLGTRDTWEEEFPHADTKTVNGVCFVQYVDCLNCSIVDMGNTKKV